MFYLKARKHQAAMYKEFETILDNRKRAEAPTLDDALKDQENEAK
jgi:hypothetical protein